MSTRMVNFVGGFTQWLNRPELLCWGYPTDYRQEPPEGDGACREGSDLPMLQHWAMEMGGVDGSGQQVRSERRSLCAHKCFWDRGTRGFSLPMQAMGAVHDPACAASCIQIGMHSAAHAGGG